MSLACNRLIKTAAIIHVVLSVLEFAGTDIAVPPKDVDAVLRTSVIFNCSSSNPGADVQWAHYSIGKPMVVLYAFGKVSPQYTNRFTIVDGHNLHIPSVAVDDAGTYECQDDYGHGEKQRAKLIVLEGTPICRPSTNIDKVVGKNICGIEPGHVTLSCTVQFHGNNAPTLEWKKNGDDTTITSGISNEIRDNRVLHYLTLKGDSIANGSSYYCRSAKATSNAAPCDSVTITTTGETQVGVMSHDECQPCTSRLAAIVFLCFVIIILICSFGTASYILRKRITEKTLKINTLRNENTADLSSERKKIEKLQSENDALKSDIKDIYTQECKEYVEKPFHITDIPTQSALDKKNLIKGISVLENELFVLHQDHPEIEVYETTNEYKHLRTLKIPEITEPFDLACGKTDSCLFIIGRSKQAVIKAGEDEKDDKVTMIVRLKVNEEHFVPWKKFTSGHKGRLSTYKSNLVVCFSGKNVIKEFLRDGNKIHKVDLSQTGGDGLKHPLHAIKVNSMYFAVSSSDAAANRHRVCLVDINGNLIKQCTGFDDSLKSSVRFQIPVYLAEDSKKSILVADREKHRVLLLNATIKYQRVLIDLKGEKYPVRICLDKEETIMFVATKEKKEDATGATDKPGPIQVFRLIESKKESIAIENSPMTSDPT